MSNYKIIVDKILMNADILLMVVDARKINASISRELEAKIKKRGKKIIYVINKCDLLSNKEISAISLQNSIKISALRHFGTTKLLKKIMEIGKGREVTVGVVGIPNTGKSTLINALKGRHSAPTSTVSGFTKGLQKLRISKKIMMIDTPGIMPEKDKGTDKGISTDLMSIGTIDAHKIKDTELAAVELIEAMEGKIEKYYGFRQNEDALKTLEGIAMKKHILKKGGVPDTARMGREIISLCQRGKIR